MSRKKIVNQIIFPFSEVWLRIVGNTEIKKYKELADLVHIAASRVSERAKENNFPVDWAYWVAKEYELSIDWLLTGEGEKKVEKKEVVSEIQEWLDDVSATNKDFKIWFKVQFESKFPEFTEWKKRKEERGEDNKLSGISNVA